MALEKVMVVALEKMKKERNRKMVQGQEQAIMKTEKDGMNITNGQNHYQINF